MSATVCAACVHTGTTHMRTLTRKAYYGMFPGLLTPAWLEEQSLTLDIDILKSRYMFVRLFVTCLCVYSSHAWFVFVTINTPGNRVFMCVRIFVYDCWSTISFRNNRGKTSACGHVSPSCLCSRVGTMEPGHCHKRFPPRSNRWLL